MNSSQLMTPAPSISNTSNTSCNLLSSIFKPNPSNTFNISSLSSAPNNNNNDNNDSGYNNNNNIKLPDPSTSLSRNNLLPSSTLEAAAFNRRKPCSI